MNPKFDINSVEDENDDFESTHLNLEAYVRGGKATEAGRERLLWERKLQRRVKFLEERLGKLEDATHDTVEIAAIAQREIGPARKFAEDVIKWRGIIVTALVTAAAGGLVTWFLATHGVKGQ